MSRVEKSWLKVTESFKILKKFVALNVARRFRSTGQKSSKVDPKFY